MIALAVWLQWAVLQGHVACPPGQVMSGGIATSSAIWPMTCRTPADHESDAIWFAHMTCGEMDISSWGTSGGHMTISRWSYERDRCESSDRWFKYRNRRLVYISKAEYERAHGPTWGLRFTPMGNQDGLIKK